MKNITHKIICVLVLLLLLCVRSERIDGRHLEGGAHRGNKDADGRHLEGGAHHGTGNIDGHHLEGGAHHGTSDLIVRGEQYFLQGQFSQAAEYLEQALREEPHPAFARQANIMPISR